MLREEGDDDGTSGPLPYAAFNTKKLNIPYDAIGVGGSGSLLMLLSLAHHTTPTKS